MLGDTEARILSYLNRDELVSLVRDLVCIDSVIRPGNSGQAGNSEHEVVLFISRWLQQELDLGSQIDEVEPGRENLVATLDSGREGLCLLLEGHTDVVSEGDPSLWSTDPFGGEIREGRIYGRGACDMKAGLAVSLLTLKALYNAGLPFNGKIRLGFVCDEEDMMIGIKDFIHRGHADDVNAALVAEPEENQLCLSMKGALRAIVRVQGKMAHGAMPRTGINPNPRLARIILAFEAYEKREIERCGRDEYLGRPSVTFTVVQAPPAGEPAQLNVMPGRAHGYVDIRTTPCQEHETLQHDLQEIIAGLAAEDDDFRAEIEFIENRPVVTMDRQEPIVLAAASAYRDLTGKEPVYNGVPGATDGTFLRAWKNIPALVNGPGPRHLPHQIDEYVEIGELFEAAGIYALTAYRYLNE